MRNLRVVLAAVAVMAVVPAAAPAQSVQGQFKWAGTGSSFGWWWRTTGGTNRNVMGGGHYSASFSRNGNTWSPAWQWPASGSSSTAFGPAVDIYCIDFLHNANTSSTGYNAYFTKLTAASFSGPSYTTRSNDLTRYLKAAWLTMQLKPLETQTTTAAKTTRAEIHAAIWWVMAGEPGSVYDGSGSTSDPLNYSAAGMNGWVSQANANYGSVNGMEWTVVTDSRCAGSLGQGSGYSDSCSQEFLTQNVVPEPATMILLGTGLLATLMAAGVFRRPEA
jgi:hypothetical protein